ncbi:hypothetical protein GobsT_11420 [Gemmata obscuriglobus]|uniref:hypothetical protein n=1 Tax=Gemmata obscuriglobus TaxID=114 RepID=UPI00016C351D|nr:hypothetical protein [Gemmata obscuriglobus]QEG26397.1 hypothetical protein GobsT_11360 [Gemmata obscuriglobus]QEG26403.1 hypothetical protein GobsT_11420 [Gemmata obscuriglobus]VTS01480.1 Uncharacterized protein OS=Cellulomonas flavigena (strain ATCC 482 / DSM 20109 / NCIB 8073 / NRS 134) GN=Cfla_0415 PE=4 SV=1 [Gemmata obscuriglobus UQM 2246]VTS01498.1 Uncharacterized protein OS=Cellulomonas flavigena (strain ATCC 482 / DSM 20109 / NCIB 8073 / NRS 134) GN=Cfla_0415 PE=4 SV=1 [Gemmata obscu
MAEAQPDDWWPDEEYVPYLEAEQRLYAWVLARVGGVESGEAMRRAVARFHYEPMAERGLMTHAGAWRIAMCDLFGDHCHSPAEFGLAAEYAAEERRWFHDE